MSEYVILALVTGGVWGFGWMLWYLATTVGTR